MFTTIDRQFLQNTNMECVAKQAARRARLEAEGRSAEQDSEVSAHRRGRRLWEEVHTMYYSRCAA